ncbi:uncharacterized protein ACRADG_007388 isoform 2-T2 [Cochliomyia hominivorax]
MAGIAILQKPNKQNNNTNKSLNSSSAASLQITYNNKPANICCCLWLQQTTKVVVANTNSITNDSLMKPNVTKATTTNYCCWHNTTSRFDDRILTNYNCNIKTATATAAPASKKQQQQHIKRPLTPLSIAVLIMSLSILLIQMPTMVQSKAIYDEKISASYDYSLEDQESRVAMETSAELEAKLLSLLTKKLSREEHIANLRLNEQDDESESDQLTSLDVLKHMQRTEEHQKERRRSLRKRHSRDLIITRFLDENGQNLEWKNPCNVARVDMSAGEPEQVTKHQIYQYYRNFANIVGIQHEHLNYTTSKISLHDMSDWDVHSDVYKFLPKLNVKGNIALSRWYRNLQVYVGSFGYLARSQYKYDMGKRQYVGETSQELNKLLQSARSILCELETTINGSAPNNNLKKLNTISRRAMNGRLNFVTKNLQRNGAIVEPSLADLKFAKYSYLQYLSNMERILKQKLRAMSKKYGFKDNSDSDINSNISNTIVGDVNSSSDFIFKSDASDSVSESFEQHFKSTKRPQTQRRRSQKRKTTKLPEA